jgi:nucleoside-diphosphate-sugar epimerase
MIVNLATGKITAVKEFVERAADVLHIPESRLSFGALPEGTGEMQYSAVSVERLKMLLGWTPTPDIEEIVRRTYNFCA